MTGKLSEECIRTLWLKETGSKKTTEKIGWNNWLTKVRNTLRRIGAFLE
jgi:hypothetical protein